jgi:hypothetical protein
MKREKEIDCIEMKRRIQEQILQRYTGVEPAEARRRQEEEIAGDPILGAFLRKIQEKGDASPKTRRPASQIR